MADEEKGEGGGKASGLLENKAVLLGVIVIVQAVLAIVITQFMIVPNLGTQQAMVAGPDGTVTNQEEKPLPEMGVIVSLEEIIVTLQSDNPEIPSYLRITVALEVEDQPTADLVTTRLPQLRDLVIMSLSSRKGSDMLKPEGKQAVRTEIMQRLADKLPPNKLKSVYFSDLVIQ